MNLPKLTNVKTLNNFSEVLPVRVGQLKETLEDIEAAHRIKFTKYTPVFSMTSSQSGSNHVESELTYQLKNSNHIRRNSKGKPENLQHHNQHLEDKTKIKTSFLTFVNTTTYNTKTSTGNDANQEKVFQKDLSRAEISILDERRRLQRVVNAQLDESILLKKTLAHQEKIDKLEENIENNIKRIKELRQRLYELGNGAQSGAKFDREKLVYRKFW